MREGLPLAPQNSEQQEQKQLTGVLYMLGKCSITTVHPNSSLLVFTLSFFLTASTYYVVLASLGLSMSYF